MIKRIISCAAALCMAFGAAAYLPESFSPQSGIMAQAEEYGDFEYWSYDDDSVCIRKYNGSDEDITIPSIIDGKKVIMIGEGAFSGCTSITSITIPDSVMTIVDRAFYYCSNLTNIIIPDSITSIGVDSFVGTKWLENKQNENPLVVVNDILINGQKCSGSVTIPNGVTSIIGNAFENCTSLTSITIPNGVISIGERAFEYCKNLKDIAIPSSVKSVYINAFYGTKWLEDQRDKSRFIIINDILISTENGIGDIIIPNTVKSIGKLSFKGYIKLTGITIPDSVTSIDGGAFKGCTSLTNITIPDSVTSIGNYAFNDCKSLTSITIPNSVTTIGEGTFETCTNLTSITIPDSVTSIGNYAFSYCSSLTNITIPDSVTSIGDEAFGNCTNLTSITLPNSITSIGDIAFSECTSLTSITIPDSVTSIGDRAFRGCTSLTSITVGNNNSNYSSTDGVLYNKNKTELICCPGGKTSITIPDSVTSIGENVFDGCTSLKSITIPKSVTSISDWAFSDCTSLKSITIPDSVTSIGDYAFSDCNKLTIKCYKDSYAMDYAIENEIPYELLDAPAHTHTYTSKVTTPATCKEPGVKTYTCSCGDTYTESIPKLTTHTFGAWKTTKAATCTAEGTQTRTCSVCGETETKTVAKTAHKFTTKVVAPTYTAQGYTLHTCSVCGNSYKTYKAKLTRTSIAKASVTGISNKVYTGKALKPAPTVKLGTKTLKKGTDYTVTYKNNKNVGKATVTITGKGAYTGTITKTFKINPKATSITKLTSPKKKQLKAAFKKVSGVTGYQVTYSTSKKFTKSTTKTVNVKSTGKTVKSLKKGKTYYVKVRTFKTVGGVKYYGAYSAVKKIKVK